MGAWIEIYFSCNLIVNTYAVAPLWERGLKFPKSSALPMSPGCRSFMGAWIEILALGGSILMIRSLLYGSVD